MSTLKVEKPGEIVFTLEIQFKLKDWIELRQAIKEGRWTQWPVSILFADINDMVSKAEKEFYQGD